MKFKVTQKDFFEDNEDRGAALLFPGIPSEVCKFVVLTWDYFSPFHEMPLEQRQKMCFRVIFPMTDSKKEGQELGKWRDRYSIEIGTARKLYIEIQYDVEYEVYRGILSQLDILSKKMLDVTRPLDLDDSVKISEKITKLITEKRKLEVLLKYRLQRDESDQNMGKEISSLDRFHINNQKKLMNNDSK